MNDNKPQSKDVGAWFQAGNDTCPDCGGRLREGPRGGCSINVRCEACHAEFNVSPGPFSVRLSTKGRP